MKENVKIGIFEASVSLATILLLCFLALPAYWESGGFSLSLSQMIFGNTKTGFNGLLFFAFLLVLIGLLLAIGLSVLSFLKKFNSDRNVTILAICSAACILVGTILLSCGILITGLDKSTSELGFLQGNWGIAAGNILVPIFGLIAFFLSYPAGMIILHHKDVSDKAEKTGMPS